MANYIIRQEFFETGRWIRYSYKGEEKTLYGLLKSSKNYKLLPAQVAQQTLRILDRNWKSFFKSLNFSLIISCVLSANFKESLRPNLALQSGVEEDVSLSLIYPLEY